MAMIDFQERTLPKVVDQYVESRKKLDWPISIAHALRAIRTAVPQCSLPDRQLAEMVASSAIAKGRNVAFDLPAGAGIGAFSRARSRGPEDMVA